MTATRRRSRVWAIVLVVGLCLTNLPRISTEHSPQRGLIAIISLAVVLPLIWRHRAPLLMFGISAAAAAVQWALIGPLFADLALLVGFYTVAATAPRRQTLLAAGVLEFGVVVAVAKYGHNGGYALAALLLTGLVVAAGVLGLNVKVRAAYLAEVEARADRLERERDQQGRLAVSAERTRIAREMHDIVAHNLSVMIALNDGASFMLTTDPRRAAEAVRAASAVGRTALSELQRALGVLREPGELGPDALAQQLPESLAPAPTIADLDRLLEPIRRTGLAITLTIGGSPDLRGAVPVLAPGLQLTIYRLVQESLTNVVKHARDAKQVAVSIRYDSDRVEVRVVDDGQGSDVPAAARAGGGMPSGGHGLVGM
jgi:signal transduction histidine kinase